MIIISCSVLITREDRVLLIQEQKEVARGKFGLPGGKLENGERLRACAIRECKEETGLDVDIEGLVMVSVKPLSREGNTVLRYIYKATSVTQSSTGGELADSYLSRSEVDVLVKESNIRGRDVAKLLDRFFNGDIQHLPEPEEFD